MPSLTELRERRRLLEEKYGPLPSGHVDTPPRPAPPQKPKSDRLALIALSPAQLVALMAIAARDGTTWQQQLDQAIASYADLREAMPDDEWDGYELPAEMHCEAVAEQP